MLGFISVSQFSKLTINPSFNDYIPSEVGNRAYLQKLNGIFGGSEKIMLILTDDTNIINQQSYNRLQHLTEELKNLEGIERCLSLIDVIDIRLEEGITTMDPIIDEIPSDTKELDALKQTILNSSMGQRFVSSDLSSTAIILTISPDIEDNKIIPAIEETIQGKKRFILEDCHTFGTL